AAAETGKDRYQRSAKAECHQRLDDATGFEAQVLQDEIVDGDAQQTEADDQHACYRPRLESDVERGRQALAGSLCGADVGPHGNVHADIARTAAEDGPDDEADGDVDPEREGQNDGDDDADYRNGRVLAVEIGSGSFLDSRGDLPHLVRA